MVQEQASHGEKRLAERVSIIVQGLVRCGGGGKQRDVF